LTKALTTPLTSASTDQKNRKKVCIVEDDIKMTKDEIEIYNQMRDEAE